MKICMLVRNSVSKDARVLKEANSLINAGHDVTVIGIQDAKISIRYEVFNNGLKVNRVAWKAERAKYTMILLFIVSIFTMSVLLLLDVFDFLSSLKIGLQWTLKIGPQWIYSFIIILCVTLLFGRPIRRAYKSWGIELQREEFEESPSSKGKGGNRMLILKILLNPKKTFKAVITSFKYALNQALSLMVYQKEATKLAVKLAPDIVHAHDIATLPVGVAIKKKLGIPLVYDAHEIYEEAVGVPYIGRMLYKKLNHRLLNKENIDVFITINESFIKYYKKVYKKVPDPVLVMNATVKSDYVRYDGRLHEAAGLDISTKIILFQGGFSKKRGILNLLEASDYLKDGWCLVFMGWGFYEKKIMNFVGKPDSKVRLLPAAPQNELSLWTAGATVGVIPYEEYGLNHKFCTPNKLWEYPNARVPILATPRVELSKMLTKYETGRLMVEPVEPRAFADEMMFNEEDVMFFKNKCSEFIEVNSWERYEKNILLAYEGLIEKK